MSFRDLVIDLLRTYPLQNSAVASILEEQIQSIDSIGEERNGYGAYANLKISRSARALPGELRSVYLQNTSLIKMEGRRYELQFVLSSDRAGYIDLLEIVPSDAVGWDGVVLDYTITDGEGTA